MKQKHNKSRSKIITSIFASMFLCAFFFNSLTVNSAYRKQITQFEYEGFLDEYSFAVSYLSTWKAKTVGDDLQGITRVGLDGILLFEIQEFKGKTYDEAIDFYINDDIKKLDEKFQILYSENGNLLAKVVTFAETANEAKKFQLTFIKRGLSVFVLSNPNMEGSVSYPYVASASRELSEIYNSFHFTDQYSQYINYKEGFAFVYPKKFTVSVGDASVHVFENNIFDFAVNIHKNTTLDSLVQSTDNLKLIENTELKLENGYRSTMSIFEDKNIGKKYKKYFIQRAGDVYELTGENIEKNYPSLDFYKYDIENIVASFEFFDATNLIELGEDETVSFPDIPADHQNRESIINLAEQGVINGFPDGSFGLEKYINRAELVKMVVAAKTTPDIKENKYCFSDVKVEWYAPYICYAKSQNWVNGYDENEFRPSADITRYEAIKIILESLIDDENAEFRKVEEVKESIDSENDEVVENIDDTDEIKNIEGENLETKKWYESYYNYADTNEFLDIAHVIEDDYKGGEQMTRKEVAEMIFRVTQSQIVE